VRLLSSSLSLPRSIIRPATFGVIPQISRGYEYLRQPITINVSQPHSELIDLIAESNERQVAAVDRK